MTFDGDSFHYCDPVTGNLLGAISSSQAQHVRRLVEAAGNAFTYREFPSMPHSMHGHAPETFVTTVTQWLQDLASGPGRR